MVRDFGGSDVTGRPNKHPKLPVGDRMPIDPERADGDAVGRRLFRIMAMRPHAEPAARGVSRIPYGGHRRSSWPDAYAISAPATSREEATIAASRGNLATFQERETAIGITRWHAIEAKDLRIASCA